MDNCFPHGIEIELKDIYIKNVIGALEDAINEMPTIDIEGNNAKFL